LRKEHPDVTEPDKLDDLELDLDLSLESLDDPSAELGLTPLPETGSAHGAAVAHTPAAGGTAPAVSIGEPASAAWAATAGASAVAEPPAQNAAASVVEDGMWVWQYAAPAPAPAFSAVFFGGRGLPELYRFFACGLLVALGCLLPWGTSLAWIAEQGQPTLGVLDPPAGYQLPMGALCLALSVWLMFTACYGIYSGRQKILPVFLMLVPAWASWSRTLDAWAKVAELPLRLRLEKLFEVAGPGVLLTLVGSTIMALSLLVVIVKVLKKKPDDGTARAPRKGKEKDGKPADAATVAAAGKAADAEDAAKRGRQR
jgi:hypothetical protein